jgi:peptidoglycan/LPS O-acetylase OafA/YrhL
MFYKLESLRGIAACLVVLLHLPFKYGENTLHFVSNSYLFVDFFFILSGFVMNLAYFSRIKTGLKFKPYLILRLGRIYPLHVVVLFIWLPYIFVKQFMFDSGFGGSDQFENNNFTSFVSNILLINSMGIHDHLSWNTPAWSISTELFAYIFFYWFTVSVDRNKSLTFPLFISIICYSFIISLERPNLDITYDYGFFRCLGAFYIGVFISRFYKLRGN